MLRDGALAAVQVVTLDAAGLGSFASIPLTARGQAVGVLSIGMQAKSLEVTAGRGDAVPAEAVLRIAGEVGELSRTVLADLRAMVHELQPSSSAVLGGLEGAVRALAESTANRTGLSVEVFASQGLGRWVGEELAEDVYRVIAEALHNVVRHAEAGKVIIRLELDSST